MHHGHVPSAGAKAKECLGTLTLLSCAAVEPDCGFVEPLLYLWLSLCLLSCELRSQIPSLDVKTVVSLSFFLYLPSILLVVVSFSTSLSAPLCKLLLTLDWELSSLASQKGHSLLILCISSYTCASFLPTLYLLWAWTKLSGLRIDTNFSQSYDLKLELWTL